MISIIVPVYNVEQYLPKCIESLLCQTYSNIEIILIDDGSTDRSSQICDKYKEKDKRIKVVHKDNGGVSSARNLGLKIANGDYIGFVDSDDWVEPEMYETMLNLLLKEDSQMCICTSYVRDGYVEHNSKIYKNSLNREECMKYLLDYNFPSSLWSCLYKKSILSDLFLNETIHHLEDFEYQFRVLDKVDRVAICNKAFYNYRTRKGSANNNGFNPKIWTCLDILPILTEYIENKSTISKNYIEALKSRLTLTVSAFMAKSKVQNKELVKEIEKNAREAWFKTLFTNIPYKKKILIVILAISYRLYAWAYCLIKCS